MTSATISIASLSTSSLADCGRRLLRTSTRGAGLRGSTTVKQDPWPSTLVAAICPPCQSTIDLQIARPSPVPP